MLYILVIGLLSLRSICSQDYVFLEPSAKQIRDSETRPPILLIPGLVSSRLIAWQHKRCRGPDINIQDYVWLNLQKLAETMTYDHHCWLDCLKLGKNGSDPSDCKIRADEGLGAIGELSPGNIITPRETSIFTDLIKLLANDLGYDVNRYTLTSLLIIIIITVYVIASLGHLTIGDCRPYSWSKGTISLQL